MACASEFRELANLNRFVQDLEEQGYLLDFVGGYFLIYGLPYLNARRELVYGDWASPVDLSSDGEIDPLATIRHGSVGSVPAIRMAANFG